ncbi:MAG: tetratricopeptide repeat protein [Bacteroidetes bacterium]|nr:tetratricopeptide repeat protein [Bacteroidota bacterium]MBU1579471.1 tetratricopeptide repeat protein [Bacteroidota bacterium]MBU2465841.1 tetratricopeptide repeat protein [Bacteroidota bacterium]MBU2557963.1 tetratricopeptide repeat protein [Bacteroidota bacterium]
MANNKGLEKGDERLESVEEALSKSELFIVNNQKTLISIITILIVIVLGYFGVNKYYIQPNEKEAQTQMFMAEWYFEADSLNKALYGDGNNLGFIDIIDEYSFTDAGNLAKYYAGISLLKQGEFEEAVDYLKEFNSDDHIVAAMAMGALGDAYLELNRQADAASQYEKAADHKANELTSPMYLFKAGQTYELMGENKKALNIYEQISREYPSTTEGRLMEKYIARLEASEK